MILSQSQYHLWLILWVQRMEKTERSFVSPLPLLPLYLTLAVGKEGGGEKRERKREGREVAATVVVVAIRRQLQIRVRKRGRSSIPPFVTAGARHCRSMRGKHNKRDDSYRLWAHNMHFFLSEKGKLRDYIKCSTSRWLITKHGGRGKKKGLTLPSSK